jgi:EmrB/QacA subfamily drug resistance transporter
VGIDTGLSYGSARGRWVIVATVLGSGMAFLDSTVVNIALPRIGTDLGIGLSGLQWTVNSYTLTLSGFLLLGGSLGDRYGRKRVFVIGVVWFAIASLLCAIAPSGVALIGARAIQGIGAALLTPGSLAIIEASFRPEDRGAAIGAWSGLGGVTTAFGPFLGGWLVEAASWRLIFLINLPIAVAVIWVTTRHVPETRDEGMAPGIDVSGALLAALGLAGVIYALTEAGNKGWTAPVVIVTGLVGLVALAVFVVVQARSRHPMLPLDIFRSHQFTAANAVTFVVYGALGGSLFLLPIVLQRASGFSPLEAGTALVPLTIIMLLNSARAGRLAQRIGPRLPMTAGPLIAGVGVLLLTRVGAHANYVTDVLPGVAVFALGLSFTVAPLTATVLAAASEAHAGVASAVNNEVARVAGLVAVAALPIAVGITASTYGNPAKLTDGFHTAVVVAGLLCMAGGVLSWLTIRNPEPARGEGEAVEEVQCSYHCAVDATPLAG